MKKITILDYGLGNIMSVKRAIEFHGFKAEVSNLRKEIEDSLRKARDPFARGESFSVHEVIDPRETRKYLSLWAERIQTQLLTRNYLK